MIFDEFQGCQCAKQHQTWKVCECNKAGGTRVMILEVREGDRGVNGPTLSLEQQLRG